jgi:hypothetical protein
VTSPTGELRSAIVEHLTAALETGSVRRLVRQRSIPICSRLPNAYNMRAIYGAKRSMLQFSRWPKTARRSSMSFDWGTADNWCGGSFAANDMTSSARGKVRWSGIFPGSMPNGRQGAAMARSCGGASRNRAFAGRSGSSPSGPPGVAARKRLMLRTSGAFRQPAPLLV